MDVLGVGISAINMAMACDEITRWIDCREQHYVCVTGVHGVMESQRDPELLAIHNASGLTVPDGMPMVWAGRRAGADWMSRVYGPDLMLTVLERAADRGWSSFLYGGNEGVGDLLATRLRARFPGLKIAGTFSPPFRPLNPAEDDDVVHRIDDSGADIVWVGLSTPKQERWMAAHVGRLAAPAMVGVGAAFDFHAGLVSQAPPWIQQRGLEWLFRFAKEPRRLWKRYLRNNPEFVAKILRHPPQLRDQ
ncbi:WecB/TagA/CpsF family glycosyltransferase [Mycobacterium sp. OAE908]|uniref:WecB/TagA/CpsF family glycosyltransferase n=1 Tax=Mycobacterium sp. OAE908 TaxID=2817899 RepID=UPI001AE1DA8F